VGPRFRTLRSDAVSDAAPADYPRSRGRL